MFITLFFLVYWLLNIRTETPISLWILRYRKVALDYYQQSPFQVILVFCLAHFFSATFSIPGSCTFLNIFSGSIFGFWRGVAIVYLITLFSGAVGYFLGEVLPLKFFELKYSKQINQIKNGIMVNGYFNLILIRLSPIFPYGILNLFLGYFKIPFGTYMLTTFIGIFFDVVLLNSAGAFLSGSDNSFQNKIFFGIVFFVLLFLFYFVKISVPKWKQAMKSRGNKN